jgi:hypothetical protein
MFKIIKYILLCSICISFPLIAGQQDTNDNDKLSCRAKHLDTDKEVEVKIVSSIPGKKIATAQWLLGYPTIAIDDSAFAKLPKNAKQFVYYHECAHLRLMSNDEHEVDCESINLLVKQGHYSEIQVRRLIQALKQEFGWSKRWSNLLDCKNTD